MCCIDHMNPRPKADATGGHGAPSQALPAALCTKPDAYRLRHWSLAQLKLWLPRLSSASLGAGKHDPKKSQGVLRQRVQARYAWIDGQRVNHRLATLCRALEGSAGGYHAWKARAPSARATAEVVLALVIAAAHHEFRERYGSRRLWRELGNRGVECGRHRMDRPRREHGLWTRRRRRFLRAHAAGDAIRQRDGGLSWPRLAFLLPKSFPWTAPLQCSCLIPTAFASRSLTTRKDTGSAKTPGSSHTWRVPRESHCRIAHRRVGGTIGVPWPFVGCYRSK